MKRISVLVALLFSASVLFAQQAKLGIKAGVNVPKWSLTSVGSDFKVSSYPGLEIGVLGDFPITKSVSIQPEISYSSYGTKFSSGGDKVEYRLNYVTVPLLAKYSFASGLAVYTGPQLGFLMSAKGKFGDGEKEDVKSGLKNTDVFLVLGTEYNFQMGVTVFARYNHGLVNIYEVGEEGDKIKNTAFGFGVAYKINAPKKK